MSDIPPPEKKLAPRKSGRISWRRKLFYTVILIGLVLALLEGVTRLIHGQPQPERLPLLTIQANQTRGYEMTPNSVHYTYDHRVAVNSLGLRGGDVPANKAPGKCRVLVLGDSLVYGHGVAEDDTIPSRMEKALNEQVGKDRTYRVINGGVQGYSTHQELALLKEVGPAIVPDVVVLFWFWNDIEQVDVRQTYEHLSATGPVTKDMGTKPEGWPLFKWRIKQVARSSALLMLTHDLTVAGSGSINPASITDCIGRLDGHFAEFASLSQQWGFRCIVAILPEPFSIKNEHFSVAMGKQVEAVASTHGIPSVNLLGPMRERYQRARPLPLIPYDGHYTAEGNETLARGVVETIISSLK